MTVHNFCMDNDLPAVEDREGKGAGSSAAEAVAAQGKGGVLAAEAVTTRGKGGDLAAAVEARGEGGVLPGPSSRP